MFAASKTASVSGGYQISRSLRFNSADSAYLNRTPAGAGNRRKWTFSAWVKRSSTGDQKIFSGGTGTGSTDYLQFYFASNDAIKVSTYVSDLINTTSVYRDYSAWYHVVLNIDTDNATATNRMQLYVNNTLITTANVTGDLGVNQTQAHYIGYNNYGTYFGGYMTEINFINDQALTPSSFGQTDAQTGVWGPKAYSGSYGTNGFYLNFSDNSNTTAATLGKDYSGNGNNWTPNNFSVTAGAGNDSLVDSPTSYGTDTGVGGTVRGNYCTLNPLSPPSSGSPSYTNGNLDGGVATYQSLVSTFSMTSSKWYWEVTPTGNTGSAGYFIAVSDANFPMSTRTWQGANFWGYFSNGSKYTNGGSASYGASFTTNDVIGVALDMDAGTVTFYKNGTSQGVAYSSLTGKSMQATVGDGTSGSIQYFSCNFGQRPFAYTAPSGFKALCTQNLPTPTIGATTATQAGKYFNPVLYTGTGATNSITGVGFQPDWVWIKARSAAYSHRLADSVRGAGKELFSNESVAEATNSANGYVSSFNSDGFSLTSGVGVNGSGTTFVAWNWKANGAGSSNTAGSITSTASASTTSGFSVVTYTGTGANATVGHGLGVAPSFIIVKRRDDGSSWNCYHISLGASQYIQIDGTAGAATNTGVWNNTAPTSTVFSIGTAFAGVNASGSTHVAYCFAEVAGYSKFGSYTGNGSADGSFVYTGFRPAFFFVKKSDSGSESWVIVDNSRNTSNVMNNLLLPNTSGAEVAATYIDALSNGFKCRESFSSMNASGGTYIYMAFASNPFKYSLAR